jgi:hypothetical protein
MTGSMGIMHDTSQSSGQLEHNAPSYFKLKL